MQSLRRLCIIIAQNLGSYEYFMDQSVTELAAFCKDYVDVQKDQKKQMEEELKKSEGKHGH